ncbi:hypothetical protein BDW22DRAFT_1347573 [Trametopsis cervina]|nr:hypothetical protein BDW22DRAFT_1347573 [Trametopsis cervina]
MQMKATLSLGNLQAPLRGRLASNSCPAGREYENTTRAAAASLPIPMPYYAHCQERLSLENPQNERKVLFYTDLDLIMLGDVRWLAHSHSCRLTSEDAFYVIPVPTHTPPLRRLRRSRLLSANETKAMRFNAHGVETKPAGLRTPLSGHLPSNNSCAGHAISHELLPYGSFGQERGLVHTLAASDDQTVLYGPARSTNELHMLHVRAKQNTALRCAD